MGRTNAADQLETVVSRNRLSRVSASLLCEQGDPIWRKILWALFWIITEVAQFLRLFVPEYYVGMLLF
jgi:hypothetical protein